MHTLPQPVAEGILNENYWLTSDEMDSAIRLLNHQWPSVLIQSTLLSQRPETFKNISQGQKYAQVCKELSIIFSFFCLHLSCPYYSCLRARLLHKTDNFIFYGNELLLL